MKQPNVPSHPPRFDVSAAWQQQLQAQRDAKLVENLKQREGEVFPRFGEHYRRLQASPRRWRRGIARRLRRSLAGVPVLLALGQRACELRPAVEQAFIDFIRACLQRCSKNHRTSSTVTASPRRRPLEAGTCAAMLATSLAVGLVGTDADARDAVLPSQDLTQWADSASLRTIPIDKEFTSDEEIYPFPQQREIAGLGLTGSIELKGASSLVRVILIDNQLNEYLAYEAYPLVSPNGSFSISNACRETCVLPRNIPSALKIELINAAIRLQSVVVNSAPPVQARTLTVPTSEAEQVDEVKEAQEAEIIELLNRQIKANGLKWIAGETSVSRLSFEEKKKLFGGGILPNLQGFEYYKGGIFDLDPGAASPPERDSESSVIEAFDWRNKHGANDPNSPYYDGDSTGSGWITDVRNQRFCGSCWAFGAVGPTEALVNLYFNQHLDLDLSEQEVLSCSGAGSCSGGFSYRALDFIRDVGVVDEACFPYSATDEACANVCISPRDRIRIASRGQARRNATLEEDAVKRELIQYGPASLSMFGSGPEIINAHCVTLVGYGTDSDDHRTFWIFKNSWGNWGENGYGRAKAGPNDFLGVTQVKWPILSEIESYSTSCADLDNDGYFNWGISEELPASCGSVSPIKDCDDSDSAVALLQDDGSCVAAEFPKVNQYVSFEPNAESSGSTSDASGCPSGFVGKFMFEAVLSNSRETRILSNLTVGIGELSGGNLLLSESRLLGVGDRFSVEEIGDFADGELESNERVIVPFTACLQERKPFRLFVDVYGASEIRYAYETVPFRWINASRGQAYSLYDDDAVMIAIGFEFQHYDGVYNQLYISSNGFVTFSGAGSTTYSNTAIPAPSAPNNLISPFWDDLNPSTGGTIYARVHGSAPDRRVTVSWEGVPHYYDLGNATFQVTLYEGSNDIVFRYKDVQFGDPVYDRGASATVGVEDSHGESATQRSFNEPMLTNRSAIRFYTD